jgi:hypothetical protein
VPNHFDLMLQNDQSVQLDHHIVQKQVYLRRVYQELKRDRLERGFRRLEGSLSGSVMRQTPYLCLGPAEENPDAHSKSGIM